MGEMFDIYEDVIKNKMSIVLHECIIICYDNNASLCRKTTIIILWSDRFDRKNRK